MRASWLFHPGDGRWEVLTGKATSESFSKQAPTPEQIAYRDSKRGILVAQSGRDTHHYDIVTKRWSKVIERDKDAEDVPLGHDAKSVMYYDPHGDVGLLFDFVSDTLWAYHADERRWERLTPHGPPPPAGKKRLAYHDPARNAFVMIAGRSVWAYRYRD